MVKVKPIWIDEKTAAKMLLLSPRTFRAYVKSNKLDIVYTTRPSGRGYQYEKNSIDKLLLSHSTAMKEQY